MSKKSNPKALGLLAGAVLVLGGGATYFQYNTVQAVKAEVTALEAEVPSQKDLERDLAESQRQLLEYQQKLAHLEGSVPDVAYIPTLMKELERMGKGHGIIVTGVRPAPKIAGPSQVVEGRQDSKKKDYEEIEIEIKGRGRYEDIKALLDALEEFPKVIAVRTVGLQPFRENVSRGPQSQLEATINLVAFVFPFELNQAPTAVKEANEDQPNGQSKPADGASVNTESVVTSETKKVSKSGGR